MPSTVPVDVEERRRARPRIADVAREAGVSKTAVSFAFNSPERLSPETAERILVVADSLGYTSIEHIARYFRSEMKTSPLAYRKRHGQK